MAFVKLVLLPVPSDLKPALGYEARVFVASDTVLRVSATLQGELGAQAIDGLSVQPQGDAVSGFVRTMPDPGDALRLAVDAAEPADTGLIYVVPDEPPIV